MKLMPPTRALLGLALLVLSGRGAAGADVEVAPFFGFQYAGSFVRPVQGGHVSSGIGLDFGGTANLRVSEEWRVELLYSRQEAGLSNADAAPPFEMAVERYMAGVQQETTGDPRLRFFGVFNLGATRFAPGRNGRDADTLFTVGLSLGLKRALSDRLALRLEGRGFYLVTSSAGATVCNGGCVFAFSGSGLWQGDVSAGLVFSF
jgi:hypothetical protein